MQLVLTATLVTLLVGCATELIGGHKYDVTLKNTGKEHIVSSTVTSSKGFWHQPGYLVPEARKSIAGPFKHPYADTWTVNWQTAKGETFEKTLDLSKAFSKPLQGQLVFLIDGNNNLSHTTQGFSER